MVGVHAPTYVRVHMVGPEVLAVRVSKKNYMSLNYHGYASQPFQIFP